MIFRSPQSDIDIPEIPLTPFVLQGAGELGDKPALVEGLSRRTLGYRKLQEMIHRAAAGFIERGLRRGEVVGICAPNVPEYAVVFHGVSLAGGINTPLNPLSAADE